jgi:hypothetical protein
MVLELLEAMVSRLHAFNNDDIDGTHEPKLLHQLQAHYMPHLLLCRQI